MRWIVAIGAILLAFSARLWLPKPAESGEIVELSEVVSLPFPHRMAEIDLARGRITALVYESQIPYHVGESVLISKEEEAFIVTDKVRTVGITQLSLVFVAVIVAVAGSGAIRSLFGLAVSFVIIFRMVLPQILAGNDPLTVALSAGLLIIVTTYYLTHGVGSKTTIAVAGTFVALIITGLLAEVFAHTMSLTGLGGEEAGFLLNQLPIASFYQLLLAGVIIGSLGVLDDITIAQASIVQELHQANSKLSVRELFVRAMRVGHDHIGSVVNTLVLVYAGSALPLLLLFVVNNGSWQQLLNYEAVAEEVLKTLTGSIGLIAAVPVTTLIASYWYGKRTTTL